MNRALDQRRGRVPSSKAFVPYTEEYLRRLELRRNAMLVDVVQPRDLGLAPQQTIANALARRFGGYAHDFFVSRYRERDFAILLPGWVSAEVLIRRQIVTLDNIWLRCYGWGPYWNARPHRVPYTAWIQLRNLPFECWTAARVASMVGGFGRFIGADDATKEMTDLRAYRCRVAVDDIREIPRTLSIVLGDEVVAIQVNLESWERAQDRRGDGPQPPPNNDAGGAQRRGPGPVGRGNDGDAGAGEGGGDADPMEQDLDQRSELSVHRSGGNTSPGRDQPRSLGLPGPRGRSPRHFGAASPQSLLPAAGGARGGGRAPGSRAGSVEGGGSLLWVPKQGRLGPTSRERGGVGGGHGRGGGSSQGSQKSRCGAGKGRLAITEGGSIIPVAARRPRGAVVAAVSASLAAVTAGFRANGGAVACIPTPMVGDLSGGAARVALPPLFGRRCFYVGGETSGEGRGEDLDGGGGDAGVVDVGDCFGVAGRDRVAIDDRVGPEGHDDVRAHDAADGRNVGDAGVVFAGGVGIGDGLGSGVSMRGSGAGGGDVTPGLGFRVGATTTALVHSAPEVEARTGVRQALGWRIVAGRGVDRGCASLDVSFSNGGGSLITAAPFVWGNNLEGDSGSGVMSSPLLKMADFNGLVGSCVGGDLCKVNGLGLVDVDKIKLATNSLGVQTWFYKFGWAFFWGSGLVSLKGPLDYLKFVDLLPASNGPLNSGLPAEGGSTVRGALISDGSFFVRSSLGTSLIDMLDRPTSDGPICGPPLCALLRATGREEGARSEELITVDRVRCLPASRVSPRRPSNRESTTILAKAIARKARLSEGADVVLGCSRAGPLQAKIKKKGRLCGVRLDGPEVNSLMEFTRGVL